MNLKICEERICKKRRGIERLEDLSIERMEEICKERGIFLVIRKTTYKRAILFFEDFNIVLVSANVTQEEIYNFIAGRFYKDV